MLIHGKGMFCSPLFSSPRQASSTLLLVVVRPSLNRLSPLHSSLSLLTLLPPHSLRHRQVLRRGTPSFLPFFRARELISTPPTLSNDRDVCSTREETRFSSLRPDGTRLRRSRTLDTRMRRGRFWTSTTLERDRRCVSFFLSPLERACDAPGESSGPALCERRCSPSLRCCTLLPPFLPLPARIPFFPPVLTLVYSYRMLASPPRLPVTLLDKPGNLRAFFSLLFFSSSKVRC
jgi:hypothetical protein